MTTNKPTKEEIDKEVNEWMQKPKIIAEIKAIQKKTGVNYKTCEILYRGTLRGFIENKEFWSKFKVVE